MLEIFEALSHEQLLASTISTIAIIAGSIIGGVCSWIVTKKSMYKTERFQYKILEDRIKYEERSKVKIICENAQLINIDICTAIFQSIRGFKSYKNDGKIELYPVPINSQYPSAVALLKEYFNIKELSYIYQLYGIIEKLNYDIKCHKYQDENSLRTVIMDYEMMIKKLYGDNFDEILKVDIDSVSYKDLYSSDLIKQGYKNVLTRVEEICGYNG